MFAWCVFICTLILCYAFCTKKLYQTRVHGTEHMLNNISLKQKYPRNIIYWKTLIARPTQKQAYRVYNSQKHMFFTVYHVVKYKKWVRSSFLGTTFLCWNCSNRMNEKFEISTIKQKKNVCQRLFTAWAKWWIIICRIPSRYGNTIKIDSTMNMARTFIHEYINWHDMYVIWKWNCW